MIDTGTRLGILISFFIASGGMYFVLYSIIQLISIRKRKQIHYLHFGFFFLLGLCILLDSYYRKGTEYFAPGLLLINFPLDFLLGPILIFYFNSFFDTHFRLKKVHLLTVLPAFICFAAFIPYYILPAEQKLAMFPLETLPSGYFMIIGKVFNYTMFPWTAVCLIVIFKSNLKYFEKSKKHIRLTLIFLITVILLAAFMSYSDTLNDLKPYKVGMTVLVFSLICFSLMTSRFADFFLRIRNEASAVRYAQSKVSSLNVDFIISRIDDLMEFEHLYTDPELNLRSLSARLELRPGQLSEIINSRYSKNFNSYINDLRIESAKSKIRYEKEHSILSVAMSCGFNSKSNFNRVFSEKVGMSPSEYRKTINN